MRSQQGGEVILALMAVLAIAWGIVVGANMPQLQPKYNQPCTADAQAKGKCVIAPEQVEAPPIAP